MVKNNEIPIEVNKKPFETVYEIKDEYKVPSWEEFENNYQESNLNYDDLSGGSVGESKGYGPCDICKADERWMKFEMACPAWGCSDESTGSWYHDNYGCRSSYMEISNKGVIKCHKCSLSYIMSDWEFACSAHGGGYRSMSQDSWRKAMGIALTLPKSDWLTNQIVMELNVFVTNHPKKFGFSGF